MSLSKGEALEAGLKNNVLPSRKHGMWLVESVLGNHVNVVSADLTVRETISLDQWNDLCVAVDEKRSSGEMEIRFNCTPDLARAIEKRCKNSNLGPNEFVMGLVMLELGVLN